VFPYLAGLRLSGTNLINIVPEINRAGRCESLVILIDIFLEETMGLQANSPSFSITIDPATAEPTRSGLKM
jgi:hypothetical protein